MVCIQNRLGYIVVISSPKSQWIISVKVFMPPHPGNGLGFVLCVFIPQPWLTENHLFGSLLISLQRQRNHGKAYAGFSSLNEKITYIIFVHFITKATYMTKPDINRVGKI